MAESTHWRQERASSGPVVTGFAAGGFKVDGEVFAGVTLSPTEAHRWDVPTLDALSPGHLDALLGIDPPPEFLLLGTGASLARPPRGFAAALDARGIGLEPMDSRAAARAWSVLRAEDRWIVAALMPL